jgi:hypothetical protein
VPAIAGVLAVGAALWWIADGARGREGRYPPGSVHDTSPDGLSLAGAYLRAQGAEVEVLARPLGVAPPPESAVVLRVLPQEAVGGTRGVVVAARDEEWVRRGGRLVLATSAGVREREGPARSVFPGWPHFTPPVPAVFRVLPPGAHALAVVGDEPILARVPLGAGEVVLLAAPGALQNRGLAGEGNLELLHRLAAGRAPVAFDEHAHGLGHSLGVLDVVLEHGLGPALVLGALAGAAAAARARVRLGPPEPDAEDLRSDAVELVASIGQLYARAMSRGEGLSLYREAYAQAVRQSTGLSGAALQERVRANLARAGSGGREGDGEPTRDRFQAQLRAINQAFAALRPRAAAASRRGPRPSPASPRQESQR